MMICFYVGGCGIISAISACAMEKEAQNQTNYTDNFSVEISPIDNCNQVENINYYNKGIWGKVQIQNGWQENGEIILAAIPQDEVAKTTAEQNNNGDYRYENGYCKIINWRVEESAKGKEKAGTERKETEGDDLKEELEKRKELIFRFQLQGRWKVELRCHMPESDDDVDYVITSEDFIIDRNAPELTVIYENCRNIGSSQSSPDQVNRVIERGMTRISSSDCEIYASGKGKVILKIKEDYFSSDNVKVSVYKENYENGEKKNVTKRWEKFEKNGGKWEQEGETFILQYEWEQEGHYRFCVKYEDFADNILTAGNGSETMVCLREGKYEGPLYTLDNTAPIIRAFVYQQEPERKWGTRSYFQECPAMKIEIEEENFNCRDFLLKDILTWANGKIMCPPYDENTYSVTWTSRYVKGKRINTAFIEITKEANHTFSGWVKDGCGQKSDVQTEECTYDTSPPEVEVRVWGEDYFIPYKTYQYFGKEQFIVEVTVRDDISGAQMISGYFKEKHDEEIGRQSDKGEDGENLIIYENKKTDVSQDDLSEYTEKIIIDQRDFKGRIYVWGKNFTGQKSTEVSSPGLLLASDSMHQKSSRIFFEISEADYTDETKKIKFYKRPITVKVKGEDLHAGVGQFDLYARGLLKRREDGAQGKSEQTKIESEVTGKKNEDTGINGKKVTLHKKTDGRQKKDISYEETLSMNIRPEEFQVGCEESPVEIEAVLTDNAGNILTKKYGEYRIVTDSVKPEIQVDYNISNAKNGKYYNCARTATVTIRDKNFNPDTVHWEISGSNQNYQIGKWTENGEIHQCEVKFEEDGNNYQIKLSAEDYAGNKTVWDEDKAFVIDKTPPIVHMKINVENAENQRYYRTPQNIVFYVKDRNIDVEKSAVYIQTKKGDELSKEKTLTLRKQGGNVYSASKLYREEGEYRLKVRCTDLAGNVAESEKELNFIIDRTAPDIRVDGVIDKMAYAETVRPVVTIADKYLDETAVHIRLEKIDSSQNSVELLAETDEMRSGSHGRRYLWGEKTFPFREEVDGIYRLQAYARDLAGNQKTLGDGIVFAVNRFGSVYVMHDALKNILKKGYMREKEGIVITEYSVNPADTRITILRDNQNWQELHLDGFGEKKTRDGKYAVITKKISSGDKKGWYVKRHYLSEKNFIKEGTYQITLDSKGYIIQNGKKRIIKETSSALKEQPIYFTVDRTPPVVQIGGLEEEYYETAKHPFVITVMDNYGFAYMDLKIGYGGERKKEQVMRITPEHLERNHSVTKELSAYEGRQIISYQAWDMAGNCLDSEETGEKINCIVMDTVMAEKFEKNGKEKEGNVGNSGENQKGFWFMTGMTGAVIAVFVAAGALWRTMIYKKMTERSK